MNTNETEQTPAGTSAESSTSIPPQTPVSADPWEAVYSKAEAAVNDTAAPGDKSGQGKLASAAPVETAKPVPEKEKQAAGDGLVIPTAKPEGQDGADNAPLRHWSPEVQGKFTALPDEGKTLVMDFYKGMQASFTQGMQALSDQRKAASELLSLQDQFKADPKGVLAHLATSAGVEVFFERPLPEGEIPEFETMQDAVRFAKDAAKREILGELQKDKQATEQKFQAERTREQFQQDLQAAAKYPDFVSHKDVIMQALAANSALSAEQADQLATYAGLRQLALEGQSAKTELAKLKKEAETRKAAAGNPGATGTGQAVPPAGAPNADPWDAIYARAEQRIASQSQH